MEIGQVGLPDGALGIVRVRLLELVCVREQRRFLEAPHHRAADLRHLRVRRRLISIVYFEILVDTCYLTSGVVSPPPISVHN